MKRLNESFSKNGQPLEVKFVVDNVDEIYSKASALIIVQNRSHIKIVEMILRGMDEVEYINNYPRYGLVRVFDAKLDLLYTGKFDLSDVNLFVNKCKAEGITINVFGTEIVYDDYSLKNYIGQNGKIVL